MNELMMKAYPQQTHETCSFSDYENSTFRFSKNADAGILRLATKPIPKYLRLTKAQTIKTYLCYNQGNTRQMVQSIRCLDETFPK